MSVYTFCTFWMGCCRSEVAEVEGRHVCVRFGLDLIEKVKRFVALFSLKTDSSKPIGLLQLYWRSVHTLPCTALHSSGTLSKHIGGRGCISPFQQAYFCQFTLRAAFFTTSYRRSISTILGVFRPKKYYFLRTT